jgi:amidase
MTKYVRDAAILLGVLEGAAPDPNDPATNNCASPPKQDYTQFLKEDGLKGARIGIPRAFFYEPVVAPGDATPSGGLNPERNQAMNEAIAVLKEKGAVIIDPADIPSVLETNPAENFLNWGICGAGFDPGALNEGCSIVLEYGMKRDFNAWLASLGSRAPVPSLTALRQWNNAHTEAGAIKYGQSTLDRSDAIDLVEDRTRYEADRAKDIRLTATHGIDEVMKAERLDALLFPGQLGAAIAARPGYPTVTVPFAKVPNEPTPAFPDGFDAKPAPFGVSFTGMACSEPKLLALAYAFEQASKRRVPPPTP